METKISRSLLFATMLDPCFVGQSVSETEGEPDMHLSRPQCETGSDEAVNVELEGPRSETKAGRGEAEARFRHMADNAPIMMWVTEPDGSCTYLNKLWYDFTGQTPTEAEGFGWLEAVHPDDREWSGEVFRTANAKHEQFRVEYRLRRKDGVYRWAIDAASPHFAPDGSYLGYIGSVIDIGDRRDAEDAARASEAHLRLVLNSTTNGFYAVDREGTTTLCNLAAVKMLGFNSAEEAIGKKLHGTIHHSHPDGSPYPVEECPIYRCASTGEPSHVVDEFFYKVDGTPVPVEYRTEPLLIDGQLEGAICTFVDISERKKAQEQQTLLMRELNHRIKNLFSIAIGMVQLSARSATTAKEMADGLRGRLSALAHAHELIRPAITGAEFSQDGSTFEEVLRETLSPYFDNAGHETRVALQGPHVPVAGNSVTSLALVFHELTTNAIKYGALSTVEGSLEVRWAIEGQMLNVTWTERGGPTVTTPTKQGFGSQLTQRSVAGQLGGAINYDWQPDGLKVSITASLNQLNK